MLTMISVCANK